MLEVADSFPFDLVTNVHPRTYPRGLSIEIITTTALELAAGATAEPDDREHVTRYFYRNAAHFRIKNIASGQPEYASLELAVDCEADRARAAWIFEHISSHPPRLDELVTLARAWQGCSEPTASTA
jgi:spore coat polysaccharide biosynthesis protein SpsF